MLLPPGYILPSLRVPVDECQGHPPKLACMDTRLSRIMRPAAAHTRKWLSDGGWLLLSISFAALWVRLAVSNPLGSELWPQPDAVEYAETARRLAAFHGAGLDLSGVVFPSRYPLTFPLLFVPVVWMLGGQALLYWKAMAVLGALSVLLGAVFARRLTGSLGAAALVGALMALSPAHISASHFVMSDLGLLLLFELLLLLAWKHTQQIPTIWEALLAGALTGAMAAMRPAALPLSAAGALYYLLRLAKRGTPLAAFLAGACLFPAVEALNRFVYFGSILENGYAYYLPSFRPGSGFKPVSLAWITRIGGGHAVPNYLFYGRMLVGTDPALVRAPWGAAGVLALAGCVVAVVQCAGSARKLFGALLLFAGPVGLALLQMAYFWQDPRMVLPLLIPVAVCGAFALEWGGSQTLRLGLLARRQSRWLKAAMWAALLAGALVMPMKGLQAAMSFPTPRDGFTPQLHKQLGQLAPRVVLTNLGVLRVRNLLFGQRPDRDLLVVSMSDALLDDEHAYRNNRLPAWGRQLTAARQAPVLVRWPYPDYTGSGQPELQRKTLDLVRQKLAGDKALLLFKPTPSASTLVRLWAADPAWKLQPLGKFGSFEAWSAQPR